MAYLLLPSSRLALFLAENSQLRVLPIRAEEFMLRKHEGKNLLAVSFMKSLSFYSADALEKNTKTS